MDISNLIDSNMVGVIGAASITALLGMVGTVLVAVLQGRTASKDIKHVAQQAVDNTVNVSNGFVGRMDRKLDNLTKGQQELQAAFYEHLEWHLDREAPK